MNRIKFLVAFALLAVLMPSTSPGQEPNIRDNPDLTEKQNKEINDRIAQCEQPSRPSPGLNG